MDAPETHLLVPEPSILDSILRCPQCGAGLVGVSHGLRRYHHYRCKQADLCPDGKLYRANEYEHAIFNALEWLIDHGALIDRLIASWIEKVGADQLYADAQWKSEVERQLSYEYRLENTLGVMIAGGIRQMFAAMETDFVSFVSRAARMEVLGGYVRQVVDRVDLTDRGFSIYFRRLLMPVEIASPASC